MLGPQGGGLCWLLELENEREALRVVPRHPVEEQEEQQGGGQTVLVAADA
jgi:hypothetical protein